jgi:hypothetical protein
LHIEQRSLRRRVDLIERVEAIAVAAFRINRYYPVRHLRAFQVPPRD